MTEDLINLELKISMMTEQEKKQKKKKEGVKVTVKYDFIPELIGKLVAVEVDGKDDFLSGMIIDNSTFWIKFQDVNGRIVYLNKAYLKSIIPLK